jgi:hypothetical protein
MRWSKSTLTSSSFFPPAESSQYTINNQRWRFHLWPSFSKPFHYHFSTESLIWLLWTRRWFSKQGRCGEGRLRKICWRSGRHKFRWISPLSFQSVKWARKNLVDKKETSWFLFNTDDSFVWVPCALDSSANGTFVIRQPLILILVILGMFYMMNYCLTLHKPRNPEPFEACPQRYPFICNKKKDK